MSEYLDKFLAYQQAMVEKLINIPNVVGLMFAGSSADVSRADQFSDQDFFLVVEDGFGESFRQDLSWLPNHEQIAFAPRETAHGLKVVYENGDLLEFAVFEDDDLNQPWLAVGTDFRVVLESRNITQRLQAASNRSLPKPFDRGAEYQLFLALILIGVGRYRRGEVIAADQHIKGYALAHALRLIRNAVPVQQSRHDTLNPFRRFELDYPELGIEIGGLLSESGERAARGLVEIVNRSISSTNTELSESLVVAERLGWAAS